MEERQLKKEFQREVVQLLGPFPELDRLWEKTREAAQAAGVLYDIDHSPVIADPSHSSALPIRSRTRQLIASARHAAQKTAPATVSSESETLVAHPYLLAALVFLCFLLLILVAANVVYSLLKPEIDEALQNLGGKEKARELMLVWVKHPQTHTV